MKVSDSNCEQIDSVTIFSKGTNVSMFANDVCLGDSTLVGVINLNPDISIISYLWNIDNIDTDSFTDYPETSRWYTVELINNQGCIIKDSIFLNVYLYPIIDSIFISDSIVFKEEEVTLNVITLDNIIWQDFTTVNTSQIFSAEKTKCYIFEVFNEYNCTITDSICVEVKDVFCDETKIKIPTAFSPNEDNINDTYRIEDREGIITHFRLEIFNRLGQNVFTSSDVFKYWDGTFRGEKLAPQVFDFYLELQCIGLKKLFHKGNITLIR